MHWSVRSQKYGIRNSTQKAEAKKSTDEAIKKLEDAKKQLSEALTAMPSLLIIAYDFSLVTWSISNDFWKDSEIIRWLYHEEIEAFPPSCQASGKVSEAEALRDSASHTFSLACDTSIFLIEQFEIATFWLTFCCTNAIEMRQEPCEWKVCNGQQRSLCRHLHDFYCQARASAAEKAAASAKGCTVFQPASVRN